MSDRSICVTELISCVMEELLDELPEEDSGKVLDGELSALSVLWGSVRVAGALLVASLESELVQPIRLNAKITAIMAVQHIYGIEKTEWCLMSCMIPPCDRNEYTVLL